MPARTGCSCSRQATTRTLWKTPPPSASASTSFPLLTQVVQKPHQPPGVEHSRRASGRAPPPGGARAASSRRSSAVGSPGEPLAGFSIARAGVASSLSPSARRSDQLPAASTALSHPLGRQQERCRRRRAHSLRPGQDPPSSRSPRPGRHAWSGETTAKDVRWKLDDSTL